MQTLTRIPQVLQQIGLKRSTLYALIASGEFPQQIKLSKDGRAVAFVQAEIDEWVAARIAARDGGKGGAQ